MVYVEPVVVLGHYGLLQCALSKRGRDLLRSWACGLVLSAVIYKHDEGLCRMSAEGRVCLSASYRPASYRCISFVLKTLT
jgi:hypothetical protein